jgi:hypothetical protein
MSWADLKELILQERKTLDPTAILEFPQEGPFETQQSALLECYVRTKNDVDAAIRTFAETLEWPELTPLESHFLGARLDFALEILSVLDTVSPDEESLIAYPPADRCTTAHLLRWLLIDIWPHGCGRFLQTQKWLAEEEMADMPQPKPSMTSLASASVA